MSTVAPSHTPIAIGFVVSRVASTEPTFSPVCTVTGVWSRWTHSVSATGENADGSTSKMPPFSRNFRQGLLDDGRVNTAYAGPTDAVDGERVRYINRPVQRISVGNFVPLGAMNVVVTSALPSRPPLKV